MEGKSNGINIDHRHFGRMWGIIPVYKMKKILGIAAIAVGAVFMLFGLFLIVFGDDPDDNNKPAPTEQPLHPVRQ